MPAIPTIDATTGEPTLTPQEAVASEYAKGNIKFQAGSRVPIRLQGKDYTVPAEQYEEALRQGAEPNFDPNGAVKAAVISTARSASLGASDYIGAAGSWLDAKLSGDDPDAAVARTKLAARALQEQYPGADIAGTVAGALLPTGVEGLVGRIAKGAGIFKDAGEAAVAVKTAHDIEAANETAHAAATAHAALGQMGEGSALGRLIRYVNPYEAIGKAGELIGSPVGKVFGEGAGRVAQLASEGAMIGAANSADEAELGNPDASGEALWADAGLGAVFNTSLGLVATGAKRALTAAGLIGDRLAEAAAGGSSREYRDAAKRWGWGNLGLRNLEKGMTPFESAEQGFQRMRGHVSADAAALDDVVKDADSKFEGVSAQEVRDAGVSALGEASDKLDMIGGNSAKFREPLLRDLDTHLGIRPEPIEPPPPPADTADKVYQAKVQEAGLPLESSVKEPKPPKEIEWLRDARQRAAAEGLGNTAAEAIPRALSREGFAAFQKGVVEKMVATRDPELGRLLTHPAAMREAYRSQLETEVAARNARRTAIIGEAKQAASERYGKEYEAYTQFKEKHEALRGQAAAEVAETIARNKFDFEHNKAATAEYNKNLKVSLAHVRDFRKVLDKHIPYSRSKDALLNAAVEVKHAMRGALEGKVEEQFDKVARKGNPEVLGKYLHAKASYGMDKDLERMYERSTGAEAKSFGKLGSVGVGAHLGYAAAGALMGHPAAGLAVGLGAAAGRHYGPGVAAFALHKASRLAQIKAIQTEMEIAASRSVKAMLSGGAPTEFSKVTVPQMAPHKLRMTAADAMAEVYKMTDNRKLIGRLAALHPDTPIIAPRTTDAMEGAARRAVTYLVSKIPGAALQRLQQGQSVRPNDVTTVDAQNFMNDAAVMHDPQFALDAASRGQLTSGMAMSYKAMYPAQAAYVSAMIKRMEQSDKFQAEMLTSGRRSSMYMLAGDPNPGMTLALQMNLKQQQAMASGGGKGMSHATANPFSKSKGFESINLATAGQEIESGSPGRREGSKSTLGLQ